jgi:hypothetical protein
MWGLQTYQLDVVRSTGVVDEVDVGVDMAKKRGEGGSRAGEEERVA